MPHRPTAEPKLLIIDDEPVVRTTYAALLGRAGYRMSVAADGEEGLAVAVREKPALIILDVEMPGLDGWQTLERLQGNGFRGPIVMLTGCTEIEHRVKGLGAGADDYLCKPCDGREMLARLNAVLRRSRPASPRLPELRFGSLTVDLANRAAQREGVPADLTRTEYAILEFFARRPDQLITREQLLEGIWGYQAHSNTRTVETHISRLRQKLQDTPRTPRWIQTVVAGGGYRMVADGAAPVRH